MNWAVVRERMVRDQLVARGISDTRILSAMRKIPRHRFIPPFYRDIAYADSAIPISENQTISQPYMTARMIECLRLKGTERVLEIGTGSGYEAAVLAELSKEVYTIELRKALANRASRTIRGLGYSNVRVLVGDGTKGYQACSPYDRIIVTVGARDIPPTLIKQLKNTGILVMPVGGRLSQTLTILTKKRHGVEKKEDIVCTFAELTGKFVW